jgi:integrase
MARKKRGQNEGSVYKRSNGNWRAQLTINGKRTGYSGKTKEECTNWINKTKEQVKQGYDFYGGNVTLAVYLKRWLEGYKVSIKPKTHHRYKYLTERYIIPQIGLIQLKNLNAIDIEKFYSDMVLENIGVRTIRLCHAVLHRALEKAISYSMILRNPASDVALPQYNPAEMKIWDENQATIYLIAAEGSKYQALYHLALSTGMRQGELFGLKWIDLHFNSGSLQVQRQIQFVPGQGSVFQDPKTRAGRRTIKLGEGVLHALRQHKEKQASMIAVAGKRWVNNDLIFPNSVGNPQNTSNLRRDFNKYIEIAGLPRIRFHDLRHTAASLMLNNGVPPIVVSRILGHSKPSVTLDIYGHLYHEMQGEAAKIMDELITPAQIQIESSVNVKEN